MGHDLHHEATCRFNVVSWTENLVADIDGEGTKTGDAYYPNRGVTQTEVRFAYKGDIEGTSKPVGLIIYKQEAAPVPVWSVSKVRSGASEDGYELVPSYDIG